MKVEVVRYDSTRKSVWDEFISNSKNATFLFYRNYMDYHSDRFTDYSLIIFYKQQPIALFPANVSGNCIFSHGGLTYGGVLTNRHMDTSLVQCNGGYFSLLPHAKYC